MTEVSRDNLLLLTPFSAKSAGNESPDDYQAVQDALCRAAKIAGVELKRADDVFASGMVIDQVLDDLSRADVVLAVCTGRNANVFYELGFTESLGHKPVLVAGSDADLPFDKEHWRCNMYADGQMGLADLDERVAKSLAETLAGQSERGRQPHPAVNLMLRARSRIDRGRGQTRRIPAAHKQLVPSATLSWKSHKAA